MKRVMLLMAALAAVMTASPVGAARTYFGFEIGIASAPPPPRVYFRDQPDVIFVPSSRVYVVRNDYQYGVDMFRFGAYWYVTRDGYWYRARGYRGPFRVIDVRHVPRPIFYVPAQHWKHHPRDGWPGRRPLPRDRADRNHGKS
jgi:hypothetical protein